MQGVRNSRSLASRTLNLGFYYFLLFFWSGCALGRCVRYARTNATHAVIRRPILQHSDRACLWSCYTGPTVVLHGVGSSPTQSTRPRLDKEKMKGSIARSVGYTQSTASSTSTHAGLCIV
ncbi:hypothetical protein GGR53DRAFT_509711 [Hypoxylon sp. FL1150]|nr:hypothetical protein GGR53DRAFT_509711 [Hypoxylon sp. FL1150]